ncbi:hypothetical protein R5R35_011276 [Gryllus longicercus]|uniref:Protein kinase domain-containing protein n=1 Tax=Gryllus longicercus TaxID=2509291 RepID=A0AAN9VN12_9ORTH
MPSEAPWAYLLRLPVGSGAIALIHSDQVISRDGKEYFSIRRCLVGNPEVTDRSGVCYINGHRINKVAHIEHGWKISVRVVGKEYIFVDCDLSNRLLRPLGLNGSHAIGQLLGQGGFGEVYLCFEKKSTSPIALKITKEGSDREKNILKSLKHAHIINTRFFTNVGQKTFIGMEYMAGGDLSAFVQEGRVILTENQTKLIFYQLTDAVVYLHSKGVCHRDLKPANILLHRAPPRTLIKVTDLGISKSELLHSPPNTAIGTVRFMAPETLHQNYTKKVDVWSLGVILYLSLTGRYASVSANRNDVPLPELASNRIVTRLIKKMLQISPTHRADITDVMRHEWLQDENVKREAALLRAEFQNGPTTPIIVNPPSEKLKQAENEGIGVAGTIGLIVGGIVVIALAILFR